MPSSPTFKICPHCKQLLPIAAFGKHRKKSGNGIYYMFSIWICKPCSKADRAKRYEDIHGSISSKICPICEIEFMPSRRDKKYCSVKCYRKASYTPSTGQVVMQFIDCEQYGVAFLYHTRQKHICDDCKLENERRCSRESMRRWRANNPEEAAKQVRISGKRREARKRQLPATLTVKEWEHTLEYFERSCAYCGKPSIELHQEHFIPVAKGGGYTKENIVPACPDCNQSKSDALPRDWLPADVYSGLSSYLVKGVE